MRVQMAGKDTVQGVDEWGVGFELEADVKSQRCVLQML